MGGLLLLVAGGIGTWITWSPSDAAETPRSDLTAGLAADETIAGAPLPLEQAQRFFSQENPDADESSALVARTNLGQQRPAAGETAYEQVSTALKAARERIGADPAPHTEPPTTATRESSTPSPYRFKHRHDWSEEDLRQQLARAPELRMDPQAFPALVWSYKTIHEESLAETGQLHFGPQPLLEVYPDASQLPLRFGRACQLSEKKAAILDILARKLRIYLAQAAPVDHHGKRPEPVLLREGMRLEVRGKQPEWLRPEAIPSLMQLLMHEDEPVRLMLVDLLAEIPGKEATVALAQRAVFDLSSVVRESAVAALQTRPRDDARGVFLNGLRHPWAPAADHAAEALVALADQDAVPRLISILDRPDPSVGENGKSKQPLVREVVRVNHLANCLLCHPPSVTYTDPVPGVVPNVTWQYPVVSQVQATRLMTSVNQFTSATTSTGTPVETGCHNYAASANTPAVNVPSSRPPGSGRRSGRGQLRLVPTTQTTVTTTTTRNVTPVTRQATSVRTVRLPLLVRGDITYLRQDFSVKQPVDLPGTQVAMRFDYLVRTRPATPAERTRLREEIQEPRSFEQREAVLFALRELTGRDLGITATDWQELLPKVTPPAERAVVPEATQLVVNFVRAPADRQDELLAQLRDSKGTMYTQALADAIPRLSGAAKVKAREALVDRLTRMTAATLRDKLQDLHFEIRRAAILACVGKNDSAHVPDLIDLLEDSEPLIRRVAETGLKTLTGEDSDAPGDANAWRAWWEQESDR